MKKISLILVAIMLLSILGACKTQKGISSNYSSLENNTTVTKNELPSNYSKQSEATQQTLEDYAPAESSKSSESNHTNGMRKEFKDKMDDYEKVVEEFITATRNRRDGTISDSMFDETHNKFENTVFELNNMETENLNEKELEYYDIFEQSIRDVCAIMVFGSFPKSFRAMLNLRIARREIENGNW